MTDLKTTPLTDLHRELGARMVPFAGYDMPVQFAGIMAEHKATREGAGLFDVSHMGQVLLKGADWDSVAAAFETLIPMDVLGLKDGRQRYGLLTSDDGGIRDDLMFARMGDNLFVVVNAACKDDDIAYMRSDLPDGIELVEITDRALIALQGPGAETALAPLCPAVKDMTFMDMIAADLTVGGTAVPVWISRSGYTGEDGFEMSVPEASAAKVARALLAVDGVEPIGLGARDSLRLEAGLCLYGHDIDLGTTPVEAGLIWAIQKARRPGGAREGGFPGAKSILHEITEGATISRVGLKPEGRAPMREGVALFAEAEGGDALGAITSGGFGPTVGGPVAMGYVPGDKAAPGTTLYGELRGKRQPVTVTALPFVAPNFKR